MKRVILALVVLALAVVGAGGVYQAATRERAYRLALSRGDAALRDDQTFAAIEAYSGAAALRPDSMLAYLRRGETYRRRADRGDLDLAVRDFRMAAALDSTATRPLEELGDALYQLQRYARAVEAYEQCAHLDDRSERVTYKLALSHYRAGSLDRALESLDRVLRLDDKQADAYYLRGVCLREKNRPQEALPAFEKAVAIAPALIPAREELADLYGALDRRADEIVQLQVLAGLDRPHVERDVAVGLAHARAKHWELAVLTLGSALERTPDDAVYRALGQVWLESAQARNDRVDLSKAREALERAAASESASSDTLTLYGRALLEEGDLPAAERTLQQATARYPVDPAAFLLCASAAERLNHFDVARRALIEYVGLAASDADFVARASRIAALSTRLNEPATAADWLQRAVAAAPNDLRLLTSLADAQMRSGDRPAAQATVARGLEKDPTNAALLALTRRLTSSSKF